jgi:adenylate cyclase
MERRLAAILLTDMVGYSRLMGLDEEGTIARQKALRDEIIGPKISAYGGRIVKTTGDGLLAEFPSVVDAVKCALEVQTELVGRDADVPEDRRIQYRIGINLGDIVIDGDDILGDGVNIAARLEALAKPGGVCISGTVHDHLAGKLDPVFEDGGEQTVKNVPRPVRVWHWQSGQTAHISDDVGAPLQLPDRPSIAVLPFVNLSQDAEQEFFADGTTEDIITGLSRFRSLFVIARNSTLAYKDKSPDVRQVANDLNVRYVLEGSVRRAGNRIRITGQLIDMESGMHVWADRFDRDIEDVFAVQDEVTNGIVTAIAPEIDRLERARAQRTPPDSLDAWSLYQKGLTAYHATTKEGLQTAIELFDKVNELDPNFAPAFAMAADARVRLLIQFSGDRQLLLKQAAEKGRTGIALDDRDPNCHWADAKVNSFLGHHEIAIAKARDAVALNPSSSIAHHALGFVLGRAGKFEESIAQVQRAIELSPRDIFLPGYLTFGSKMLFDVERYEEASEWARRATISTNPRTASFSILVAALVKMGRNQEVSAAVEELEKRSARKTLSEIRYSIEWNWPASSDGNKRLIDALREAGLPD